MKKLVLLSLFAVSGALSSVCSAMKPSIPEKCPVLLEMKVRKDAKGEGKDGIGEGFNSYSLAPYGTMLISSKFYVEALPKGEKTSDLQFTLEKVGTGNSEYTIKSTDGKILVAIPVGERWETQLYLYDMEELAALVTKLGAEKARDHATWIIELSALTPYYFIKNKGNSGFVGFQSNFTGHMALVTGYKGAPYTSVNFDINSNVSKDNIMTRGLFKMIPVEKDEKKK